jgi:GT2 family glycosyltransferase
MHAVMHGAGSPTTLGVIQVSNESGDRGVEFSPQLDLVVVIPTITIDDWLGEAVNSVLSQEGVDLHLVVAHDGVPPDESQPWMQDKRVTVSHSADRIGAAAILRKAIGETTEKYVARLDADDLAAPMRLAAQLSYLRANPSAVLVASQGVRIDERGGVTNEVNTAVGSDIRKALLDRNVVIHSSVLFRRASYDAAGGYDPRLRQMEDYDLWLRMGAQGEIGVLPARLISYRVHSKQMSRGAKPYGLHIRKVLRSQQRLGRLLDMSRILVSAKAGTWLIAQYLRYWRLRKPGYDR